MPALRRLALGVIVVGVVLAVVVFADGGQFGASFPPVPDVVPAPIAGPDLTPPTVAIHAPLVEELAIEDLAVRTPAEAAPGSGEDIYGVVVTVRDWHGNLLPGARVLVATQAMLPSSTIAELVEFAEGEAFPFVGATGPDGQARFGYRPKTAYHIRVEGPGGVPAVRGEGAFTSPARGTVRLEHAIGRFFGAAIRLMDGSTPLYSHSELERNGMGRSLHARLALELKRGLAERLGLPVEQVFVDMPVDAAPEELACPVSVYHARLGWFEAPLPWAPLDRARATLISVPARGVAPPLRVMVECVDAQDRLVAVDGILLISYEQPLGFPAFGQMVASGRLALLPPGRYSIRDRRTLGTNCLTPHSAEIRDETPLRLRMQWSVATTTLTITRHGRPYRGPAIVQVDPQEEGGSHAQCERLPAEGFSLVLRADRANTISVTIRGDTRKLRLEEGEVPGECHVVF